MYASFEAQQRVDQGIRNHFVHGEDGKPIRTHVSRCSPVLHNWHFTLHHPHRPLHQKTVSGGQRNFANTFRTDTKFWAETKTCPEHQHYYCASRPILKHKIVRRLSGKKASNLSRNVPSSYCSDFSQFPADHWTHRDQKADEKSASGAWNTQNARKWSSSDNASQVIKMDRNNL